MASNYIHRAEQGIVREFSEGSATKITIETDDGKLKSYETYQSHRMAYINKEGVEVSKYAIVVIARSPKGKDFLFAVNMFV